MKKVIILNGPPGVGKDTIAKELSFWFNSQVISMKEPMFAIVRDILGHDTFIQFMLKYNDRDQKEKPQYFLGGKSPRQIMIWISEEVIKPVFGDRHFGNLAAEKVDKMQGCKIVFSDGGFPSEIIPLIEYGHDVHLVRLHREGYSFEGDSRNYIRLPGLIGDFYHEYDLKLDHGKVDEACIEIGRMTSTNC